MAPMHTMKRNIAVETEDASTPPRFEHDFIDPAAGYDAWGGIAVGDFDGDGRPELTTGGKGGGFFFVYDYDPATRAWSRSTITMDVSPQVSAAATDLDGDGRAEVVVGEWGPRLLYFVCDDGGLDAWRMHAVYEGLENPHDLLAADLTGSGRDDVVVREKDGSLYRFVPPADPTAAWPARVIATELEGDGTVAAAVTATKGLDIITNQCWFENAAGDGSRWVQRPLLPDGWDFHPESRIAYGTVGDDPTPVLVVTESEIRDARIAVLRFVSPDRPWEPELLVDRDAHLGGLHTLQICDLNGDGRNEVFTAEMENERTDGTTRRPRWWTLSLRDGRWSRRAILDRNLGAHMATAADYDGDGRLEVVGKIWRANAVNGADGQNHVDYLRRV